MKRLLLFLPLALTAHAQDPFTHESTAWLVSTADLNADAVQDAIAVERNTGLVRWATGSAAGALSWSDPQPSGIENPETLTAGRLILTTRDSIAIASRKANRIHAFGPSTAADLLSPQAIFPTRVGPNSIALFDINGAGESDLLCITDGSPPDTYSGFARTYQALAHSGGITSSIWSSNFPNATSRIAAVRVKTTEAPRVAEVYYNPSTNAATFYIERVTAAGLTSGISTGGFLNTLRFCYASLNGGALSTFLFWHPGDTSFKSAAITEPSAGAFAFGSQSTWPMGKGIESIVPAPVGSTGRIAIQFTDGTAAIYDFTGAAPPVLRHSIAGGSSFLLPMGGDVVFAKANASGVLDWQRLRWNGSAYTAVSSGALPASRPSQASSNIIFLSAEPFVNENVTTSRLAHVREWTFGISNAGASQWIAQSYIYTGSTTGLSNASLSTVNAPSGGFALINQYSPTLSIYSMDARSGTALADLTFDPPPGTYPAPAAFSHTTGAGVTPQIPAVQFPVQLTATGGAAAIQYRTSGSAAFAPLLNDGRVDISTTTTMEAFATAAGARGPLHSATYTLAAPGPLVYPNHLDASHDRDGDGLGDDWEAAFNITDPNADADGDGATNLAEYQNRTDPGNGSDAPVPAPVLNASSVTVGGVVQLRLEWPTADNLSILESSADLVAFTPVTSGIQAVNGNFRYDVPLNGPVAARRYFRLRRP